MARPRSSGFDGQRDAILAQAAALFASQGYTATTMRQVAQACDVSKATLYHYVADKESLLAQIATQHVRRLQELAAEVRQSALAPREHLAALVEGFLRAYADAQHEHRVLTEDVKFLPPATREPVLQAQRDLVAVFADAVTAVRPELAGAGLAKPLTMLLFGMMNWTFTWLRRDGPLTHDALAPVVLALLSGGLPAVAAWATAEGPPASRPDPVA